MSSRVNQWSLPRVAAVVVVPTALAYGAWSMSGSRPADDLAGNSVMSPIEARQREILEDTLDLPEDPALGRRYRELSTKHYGGRLPALRVLWEPRLAEVGALARQAFSLEGMFGHVGQKAAILLNPKLQHDEAALARALAHEVVHAYLYSTGHASTSHGAEFQAELERLAAEGAFTGIHANGATRSSLRAWLDDEARRLEVDGAEVRREGEAIEQERAALEAAFADINDRGRRGQAAPTRDEVDSLNARRDSYNRRVEAANARAERGRADLAEFNRQVERYNLMLVYPDGIDEEESFSPSLSDRR